MLPEGYDFASRREAWNTSRQHVSAQKGGQIFSERTVGQNP